jgi:hypothetical protein
MISVSAYSTRRAEGRYPTCQILHDTVLVLAIDLLNRV